MRCAKKHSFIILATAISGMPTPEICFFPGQFRLTILPKEHHGKSLSVCELDKQPSNWEADTELPLPQPNLRRQCLGVRRCYDVQLGRYWETKDTRKRIKLALTISVISSKIVLSDFERRNNINRKHLEPKVFSLRSNAISFLCANDFWLRWLKWRCLARKV